MRIAFFLSGIVVSILLLGCQKEKFDGYNEIAVGRWKCFKVYELVWNYTTNQNDTVVKDFTTHLEVLILDKGRICVYEDERKRKSSRIESITVGASGGGGESALPTIGLKCPNLQSLLDGELLVMGFYENGNPDYFYTSNFEYFSSESTVSNGFYYQFERVE